MAKTKTKSQDPLVFGKENGFVKKMEVAAIENADKNFLFDIALKHFHCDNPSPSATKDAIKEIRKRIRMFRLEKALEIKTQY